MKGSTMRLAAAVSAAVREQAEAVGRETPAVRGSDLRSYTVDTVNADGTITTTDGVVARRLQSYVGPAEDDIVVISRSSSGNYYAHGRLAPSSSGLWVPLTLSSPFAATAGYYVPAYRLNLDGTASLSGMASMSGALAAGTTVATLPAGTPGPRPANRVRCTVQVAAGYFGVMTIEPSGPINLTDFNPALPGTGTKYAQFDVHSNYRLS